MKNKPKVKIDINEKAKTLGNILLASIAVAGILGIALVAPNALQILKYFLPEDDIKRHYKYRANSSLKKLISDGYIQEKITGGKKIFTLTNKGKLRYETLKTKKNKRWDGKWRVVSFDIYQNKNGRNLLRKELQEYGFRMIHQSTWAYPHPCDEYIALLKSDLSFGKSVQYMVVEYIDSHINLKEKFDL